MAIKFSSEIQFSCISELSALGDRADNPCLPQGTLLPPEIFIDMVSRRQLTLSRESLQQGIFFHSEEKKAYPRRQALLIMTRPTVDCGATSSHLCSPLMITSLLLMFPEWLLKLSCFPLGGQMDCINIDTTKNTFYVQTHQKCLVKDVLSVEGENWLTKNVMV